MITPDRRHCAAWRRKAWTSSVGLAWTSAAFAGAVLCPPPAIAADGSMRLTNPPPVAKGAAAMPKIADPSDDAKRRINAALDRLDATLGKAVRECDKDGGGPDGWERTIESTMRGPRYLSYVIRDMAFCGHTPYPPSATMSIVYDLDTGAPVDWKSLLPPALTGKLSLAPGMDGTKMVTLSSPLLLSLYLAGYDQAVRAAGSEVTDPAACKEAVRDEADPAMMVWLDARAGGLAVQFDLAHAVQVCAVPVVIPNAVLRANGASATLVDAIAAAHGK